MWMWGAPGLENTTGDGKEIIEKTLSLCIPLTRLTSTAYIPSIAVSNYSQSSPKFAGSHSEADLSGAAQSLSFFNTTVVVMR
jgi:hypothetical protein